MIKNTLIFIIVLLFAIPFTYIIIMDVIDITKRLFEIFTTKVKPAAVLVIKSVMDL